MQPTFSCLCWPYHQSQWKESGVNSPGKDTLSDTSHFYSLKVESELTKAEVKNHIYMDWVWVKLQRLCSVTNFWVYLIFLHRQDIWFQRHKYPCSWIWAWLTVWVDTDLKRTLRNIFLCLYWGFYVPLFWEILYRHFDSSAHCWRTGWLEVLLSQNKLHFHRAVKQRVVLLGACQRGRNDKHGTVKGRAAPRREGLSRAGARRSCLQFAVAILQT